MNNKKKSRANIHWTYSYGLFIWLSLWLTFWMLILWEMDILREECKLLMYSQLEMYASPPLHAVLNIKYSTLLKYESIKSFNF